MATGVKLGTYTAKVRNLEKEFSELESRLKKEREKIEEIAKKMKS
jgi:hypothetical protein